MLLIIVAAFCVFKIIESRRKGELCECIGDCEKCKIQCRNNPLYYGNINDTGEKKYEPPREPEEPYKKRLLYKVGMAGLYLSSVILVGGTVLFLFGIDKTRVALFIGAYLGLSSYWMTDIAQKREERRAKKESLNEHGE